MSIACDCASASSTAERKTGLRSHVRRNVMPALVVATRSGAPMAALLDEDPRERRPLRAAHVQPASRPPARYERFSGLVAAKLDS